MPDYEKMYFDLAARVANAIETLTLGQQEGETQFVESEPDPPEKTVPFPEK